MSFHIDHIAFIVPDLEEAIARWSRVTGYEFAPITRYRTHRYIDRDNPEPHLHDARKTISREGPPRIELLEATGTGTHSARFLGPHHLGVRGIGDTEALLAELAELGIPDDGRSIGPDGELLLFFTAPEALDGMRIEFVSTIPGPVIADDGRPLPIDPRTGRPDVWAAPLDPDAPVPVPSSPAVEPAPMPRHGLLPWLAPEQLDDAQRDFYDETIARFEFPGRATPLTESDGRLNGPYNAMLYAPQIGRAYHGMGSALRFEGSLPRAVFEVIVLLVAQRRGADYEWYAHAPLARAAGVSQETIGAVLRGDTAPARELLGDALYALVDATLSHTAPDAATVSEVEQRFGRAGVMEAIATVGHFDAIGALMRTWQTPLPAGATPPLTGAPAAP